MSLSPVQLVLEVVGQLQKMFNPDVKMVKKRIEDLISRDFLERDPVRGDGHWGIGIEMKSG